MWMGRLNMPIVNHLKHLVLLFLQRKPFSSGNDNSSFLSYLVTMGFASLLCTYLELFFTGKGFYAFPSRPFPGIFTIDIRFTLIGIPLFTFLVLYSMNLMTGFLRSCFVLTIGFIMMMIEVLSERIGLLTHSSQWNHIYSFFGYIIFIFLIWNLFQWYESPRLKKPHV
ncbi:CBO0543 family protein [Alkalihalobacillus sp. AL-G]|uniref:CBO0543 family protein n=1 Tax=Alkalihalobacillus sp. AL-G TaxID=2926399 RepID=UPI00351B92A5